MTVIGTPPTFTAAEANDLLAAAMSIQRLGLDLEPVKSINRPPGR